ncbi:enoyl-CoA hydratase [Peribacillus cavernae]|uniref:Enoyl-CoA hydratase n=1 Tax=Peribacillus cavernae TaxID=1674310 RepID=A0A3S0TXT4_9BACI|nr:MaoC/PaaZ C-terminal domain-containing protein [Peribacillus cavernae]MDQ0219436.1 3-hydroxybutyryl-CoA dehydratase [Peribacillus cavernae]RUQ27140.1 enoyl-CoA hydratase [Peribacillus cavernae]
MNLVIAEMFTGQIARLQRIFTESDVRLCNELTKDFSPVYQPNEDGWKKYYEKPIVPGLLTEGLITQVISEKLPGGACILLQKELVFYHPVHVGDEITAELEIIDINLARNWVTQKVTCYNQTGNEVVKGQVVILVLSNHS